MEIKNTFNTLNVVTCAMLAALAVVLSATFHHFAGANWQIAILFSPMHFPVLLMGILCGPWLGLIGGTLTPVISFLMSGGPAYTTLVPMIFELAMYGFLTGMLRSVFLKNPKINRFASIIALVLAMIGGRLLNAIVGGIIESASAGINFFVAFGKKLLGNFTSTWVGIIVQLVLIPAILFALQKSGILLKYLPDSPTNVWGKSEQADTSEPLVAATNETDSEQENK